MSATSPAAATAAPVVAGAAPAAPYRKPASERQTPTVAAATGSTRVTVAGGAVARHPGGRPPVRPLADKPPQWR